MLIDKRTLLKLVRWYLDKTIKLCRLNPAGELDGFGPSTRFAQLPRWSHLVELFYVYGTLKLLVCQVLQHKYDVILHALKTMDSERAGAGGDTLAFARHAEERAAKVAQLEVAAARINLLGNPYYELGFAVEPLFVYLLIIIYLIFVQTRLFVALRGPVVFGFLQMLLDPARERALGTDRQIGRQVNQFAVSSKNFMLASRERVLGAHSILCAHRSQTVDRCHLRLFELECAHERAVAEARELASAGQLVPPNRRPESVAQSALVYSALVVYFESAGFCFVVVTLLVVPWSGILSVRPRAEFRHLLFQAELVCHGLIGIQHLTFYLMNGFMSAYEQLQFVRTLARSVAALIEDTCLATAEACELGELRNSARMVTKAAALVNDHSESSAREPGATRTGGAQRLNRRLIRTLILYKLLLAQMRSTQRCVGFIGAHIILLMLAVPMLNRVYVAYLPTEVRWVLLACALFIIASSDCLVLPSCMLHARCLDLFRAMSSLLAHIDACQARCGREQSFYDAHTVWLLRREQNAPELALRRFAIDAHFLHLTYANFIGVHFWCGLLLAPMFLRDTARLGTSGNLLTDTLKIF